jgi:hypothetical protein
MSTQDPAVITFPCPACARPVPLGATVCPHDECREDLSALAINEAVGNELYQAALDRIRTGKPDEAIQILVAACAYSPQKIDNWVVLGKLRAQAGNLKEAIHSWEQALVLQPDEPRSKAGIEQAKRRITGRRVARITIPVVAALLIFLFGVTWRSIIFPSPPIALITPTGILTFPTTRILSPTQAPSLTQTPSPTRTASPSSTPYSSPVPVRNTCTVLVSLNVRSEPGVDNPLKGGLSEGDKVVILSTRDIQGIYPWMLIYREPDLTGWIYSDYCK